MVSTQIGRWALWGMTPAGRFLLERRQICDAFPLVIAGDTAAAPLTRLDVAWTDDWHSLLADTTLTGIVLTAPLRERATRIREALQAGKTVFVEGSPCHDAAELLMLEATRDGTKSGLGTFSIQPRDGDLQAAQTAYQSRALGKLLHVVWFAGDYAIESEPCHDFETLTYDILVQFLDLTNAQPDVVQAWSSQATAGFQIRLECLSGLTARLEFHRRALSGLRTGWVLEGTQGAYRDGRVTTRATDGELREESIARGVCEVDIWGRLKRLAVQPSAAEESWRLASKTVRLLEACRRSISSGQPVRCADG